MNLSIAHNKGALERLEVGFSGEVAIMNILKQDAMEAVRFAIESVLPEKTVIRVLEESCTSKNITVLSIGKAAWRMAKAAKEHLGSSVKKGMVITKYGHSMGPIEGMEIFEAGHPIPDNNSILATTKALEMVSKLSKQDLVLFLISGGGSSLFEKPADGVSLEDISAVTEQLLSCGANITEINTIRKRLSQVKGGKFAQTVQPASIFSIILSDVLGDRVDTVASGPAFPDPTSSREALEIVEKYSLDLKPEILNSILIETPKFLPGISWSLAGNVSSLCKAAANFLGRKGYRVIILTTFLSCEAKEAGSFIGSIAKEIRFYGRPLLPPCAVIFGGEPVVHLKGKGIGGRNQELALAAAPLIDGLRGTIVVSIGSDGTDGPTDAAGGMVDGGTASFLNGLGKKISDFLENNDSGTALDLCGGLIRTGPTGTNVNDLSMILCK